MGIEQYTAAEAEFVKLAKSMFACMATMLEARRQSRAPVPDQLAAPPNIPDSPPAVPDVPIADAATGEAPRTDAEFLDDLDSLFATASAKGELAGHVAASAEEIEARGVEQAANDLIERHCARLTPERKPTAKAKDAPEKTEAELRMEETYVAIARSMRNADSLETLAEVWKLKQPDLKVLPATWQQELVAEKDRHKAKLAQPAGAAA